MKQLALDNVWKHQNPLTRSLLREGFREALLSLAASTCSDEEMEALRQISDVNILQAAVHARLGLPAPAPAARK